MAPTPDNATAHDLLVRVRVLGDGPTREDRLAIIDAINKGTNSDVVAVISTKWIPTTQEES